MRWPTILMLLHCIAAQSLTGQPAVRAQAPRHTETLSVINTVVSIPTGDLRRVSLPRLRAGASLQVEFHSLSPALPVEMELLRREGGEEGKTVFRHYGRISLTARGDFRYPIAESGDYLLALRQTERSGRTARVQLRVHVRTRAQSKAPAVYTLSHEKRIAVTIFSVGFLWTTLLVCGVPIVRAFRSRKRPSSPPWYA